VQDVRPENHLIRRRKCGTAEPRALSAFHFWAAAVRKVKAFGQETAEFGVLLSRITLVDVPTL
jgi:hypothetical protein